MTDHILDQAQRATTQRGEPQRPSNADPVAAELHAPANEELAAAPESTAGVTGRQDSVSSPERANPADQPLADKAAAAAREAKDQVQSRAQGLAAERKDEAAGRVTGFARALEGAASSLEENGQATEARLTRQAADSLARLGDATHGKEVEDIVTAVEDFGRKQPVAFLTGAVLAGFALSRFLKSSTGRRSPTAGAGLDASKRPGPLGQPGGSY